MKPATAKTKVAAAEMKLAAADLVVAAANTTLAAAKLTVATADLIVAAAKMPVAAARMTLAVADLVDAAAEMSLAVVITKISRDKLIHPPALLVVRRVGMLHSGAHDRHDTLAGRGMDAARRAGTECRGAAGGGPQEIVRRARRQGDYSNPEGRWQNPRQVCHSQTRGRARRLAD